MTWVETIPWSSVLRFHVDQQWDTLTFTHSLWLHLRVTFSVSSGDPGDRDGNSKKKHMSSFLIWYNLCCAVLCLVTQSCLTLCDPMDCSPPGSPVQGVYQARILEWVAMPSSRGSSWPRDWNQVSYVSCIGRWVFFLPLVPPGKLGERQFTAQQMMPLWTCKKPFRA